MQGQTVLEMSDARETGSIYLWCRKGSFHPLKHIFYNKRFVKFCYEMESH